MTANSFFHTLLKYFIYNIYSIFIIFIIYSRVCSLFNFRTADSSRHLIICGFSHLSQYGAALASTVCIFQDKNHFFNLNYYFLLFVSLFDFDRHESVARACLLFFQLFDEYSINLIRIFCYASWHSYGNAIATSIDILILIIYIYLLNNYLFW